ncbi:MAG: carboxypeptidase Taq [Colwellia polaris]|jgi:carboxypeptidase Taq
MSEKFEQLEEELKMLQNLEYIEDLLSWDKEVMMPEGGQKARVHQQSTVSKLQRRIITGDKLDGLLKDIERSELNQRQEALLREVEKDKRKAEAVPEELMERISETSSEGIEVWREAREENDFESFAEILGEIVGLYREYANHINPDSEPYKVLFKDYEPFLKFESMEEIMEEVKTNLVPLIEDIHDSNVDINKGFFEGGFDEETQKKLCKNIARDIGLPESSNRVDVSTHPFTSGNTFDTRITTRYNANDLSESVLVTMHEGGHALYQQDLPEDEYNSPIGASRELGVHESQSRLWENHVGRSKVFWKYMLPKLEENFSESIGKDTLEACYESINHVREDNTVRFNADELTYHLHILIRFEIERKLINGEIEVEELPEIWNKKYEKYLGVTPDNHKEGVMQDIHWAGGNFGYFPTYTLGSVLSAQLFDAAESEIDNLDQKIEEGNFEPLRDWLRENVHQHGKLYETEELVKKATGEKPTPEPFLDYVEEKYSELYNL